MDSDNDSYRSENEFYYPDEENALQENKTLQTQATTLVQTKKCQQSKTSLKHKGRKIRPNKQPMT